MSDEGADPLPTYAELLRRDGAPPGSAWGLFGAHDELGTVNHLDAARVLRALECVRSGRVVNLDHPVNAFDPPLGKLRHAARHVIFESHPDQRDDYVDSLYMQSTSQIDGLRHRRHEDFGFYNGVPDDAVAVDSPTLGVGRWAERPIVGRGVLVDVAGHLDRTGRRIDHAAGEAFGVGLLEEALTAQATELERGDVVLIRTGFSRYYFEELDDAGRASFPQRPCSGGLVQADETLAWLWDRRVAMVAADNLAVEAIPAVPESPFVTRHDHGKMHQQLIALLGLALGELWALEELADCCCERGAYDFLLCAKPLYLRGGVGSPANAFAVL